jgi:hypothetical protein
MTRPNESGGGGMTGATGDLTPDDADKPFIPAELREISDREPDVTDDDPPNVTGGGTPGEGDGDEFSDREEHF